MADTVAQLGWDDAWQRAALAVDPARELEAARVVAEHRGAYQVRGEGGVAWAELMGRTFHRAGDKRELPAVGDWVLVAEWARALAGRGAATVRHVLPRRGLLVRKAAGEATVPQPLAANVDVGVVMTSANADLSRPRLERYALLLKDGNIAPVFVLTKVDLAATPDGCDAQLAVLREVACGAPVFALSTRTGVGVEEVRALAAGHRTAVLLGSSGVGKSSLLNALTGNETQTTRALRADQRGRHTTTRRELFVTPDGAWIDTPGMRELAQWIADEDAATVFPDITELGARCKFRDCQHRDEPGCAVRGVIDAARLASFHALVTERAAGASGQRTARRIAETRSAKAKRSKRDND